MPNDNPAQSSADNGNPAPDADDVIRRVLELIDEPPSQISPSGADSMGATATAALLRFVWPDRTGRPAGQPLDRLHAEDAANPGEDGAPPLRIDRFEIRRKLGSGGFGVVVLAYDTVLARDVAIKLPRPEILLSARLRQRFLREAQAAALLQHPNIVPMYGVGEAGPVWYLTRGYVAGPTLAEWLRERGAPVLAEVAVDVIRQLAAAVQHAHSRGVLHRDLKPSNVLMEQNPEAPGEWTPKLVDFGLAKRIDEEDPLTRQGELLGTPNYMAPEQAAGLPADVGVHTDVYALGTILYEMLAGKPPFVGRNDVETLRLIEQGAVPVVALRTRQVPRDLEAICLKALATLPENRYASATEFRDDLERFRTRQPVHARPIGRLARTWLWCVRRPVVAGVSATLTVLLLSCLTALVWQWRQAMLYANQVERSLIESEHNLVNWAWVQDEILRTPQSNDPMKLEIRDKLRAHYQAMLDLHSVGTPSAQHQAAVLGMQARAAELANDLKAAKARYQQCADEWRRLFRQSPQDPVYRRALAESLYAVSRFDEAFDFDEESKPGIAYIDKLFAGLIQEDDGLGELCAEYARLLIERGEALSQLDLHRDARRQFFRAGQLAYRLFGVDKQRPEFVYLIARTALLGTVEQRKITPASGDGGLIAIAQMQVRELSERDPLNADYRLLQAQLGCVIAEIAIEQNDPARAITFYEGVYQTLHGLSAHAGQQQAAENLVADTAKRLARLYREQQKHDAQLAMLTECIAICERLREAGAISRENIGDMGFCYKELADCYREQSASTEALKAYARSCEVLRDTVGKSVPERQGRLAWAGCHAAQAELELAQGRREAAIAQYRAAMSVLERFQKAHSADEEVKRQLDALQARLMEQSAGAKDTDT